MNDGNSVHGPPMNEARINHGCATANYKGSDHVFVVGGDGPRGEVGYSTFDSLEVFNVNKGKWINAFRSANLPVPLASLQVVEAKSPNYLVYAVGGLGFEGIVSTIYGLNYSKQWEKIGNLANIRCAHTTINMGSSDIPGCQGKNYKNK